MVRNCTGARGGCATKASAPGYYCATGERIASNGQLRATGGASIECDTVELTQLDARQVAAIYGPGRHTKPYSVIIKFSPRGLVAMASYSLIPAHKPLTYG